MIPCPEGTAEGVERLATIAVSIAAQLPPLDTDIDIGIWLEKWGQDPGNPQPREVLARVEAALRDDERWDRLVELLLRRLDLQEDEDEQLAALREVARIFRERLAAPARALTPGIAMLRLRPTDDELWEDLRADAGAANEWEQLVTQASEIAQAAGPTPEAARIWRELARVLRENLDRPDDALAAYREALVADPADRETRDAEADLLRAARTMAGAGRRAARGLERGRRSRARGRAHARSGRAVRDAARRPEQRDHARTNRCWPSIPTRTAASRRARWSGCTRARSAGPIWPGCWNGARCSRRRRTRSRCGAGAPRSWRTISSRSTRRPRSWSCCPPTTPRSPIAACSSCWSASTSGPNATTTTCARCSGRRTPIAAPAERLAILRRLAAEGESPPRRAGSGGRGAGADPAHRAARRRRVRRAGAHLPRRGSAGGARRGDGAPARGHRHHRGAARAAVRAGRDLRTRAGRVGAGARRLQAAPRRPATCGRRPTPPSTVWPSASDAGTSPPRRRASGPRSRPRTRARSRRCARVRRHNGELEARAGACSSTPPSARRPARRRRRC